MNRDFYRTLARFFLSILFFASLLSLPATVQAQEFADHDENDGYWAQLAQDYPAFEVNEAQLRVATPGELQTLGSWGPVLNWPHIPVTASNLPDGRILSFASNKVDAFPSGPEFTYAATWDPATGDFVMTNHASHDMFCAHQVMLDDGRLMVMGGRNTVNLTSIFNPTTNTWEATDQMGQGRWYPTSVAMPDGEVVVAVGSGGGIYPEAWNEDDGWRYLSGVNLADPILNYTGHYESNWWPLLHVAPNGEIFHSGPTPVMHSIDPSGTGSITVIGPAITDWYPKHGSTVMYEEGKLLVAGGAIAGNNLGSTNRAAIIDLTGPTPVITNIASMHHARKFQNGVMLPTGEVLMIGGNTSGTKFSDAGTVLTAEVWDPDTGLWTELSDMSVPRNYHSIALLNTDGTVLSGGGGLCGSCAANHQDAQVFSPGYLYNASGALATRPNITAAADSFFAGEPFSVLANAGMQRFSLIKMSSTTHGVNSDVRQLAVSYTEDAPGQYTLNPSPNVNVLTPGYWMLFAIDGQGVPSEAAVVKVRRGENALPQVQNPGTQGGTVGTTANLQIVATDADGETLTYSANGLPTGLSINSSTGLITGTFSEAGNFTTQVIATDPKLSTGEAVFDWAVSPPVNNPPVITAPGDQNQAEGDLVDLAIEATDPEGSILTYSASGLPDEVQINATTGVLSGYLAPGSGGTHSVDLMVSDGTNTTTKTISWNVTTAPGSEIDFVESTSSHLNITSIPGADGAEKDVAFGDFNQDGWEDLVIVRKETHMSPGAKQDILLINNNGTLDDVTATMAPEFITTHTDARDVAVADVNADGWPDLVIATTFEDPPRIYVNQGNDGQGNWQGLADETSTRLPTTYDVNTVQFCAVKIGDVTGDGAPDIYLANYHMELGAKDVLLVNDGSGNFVEESEQRLGTLRNSAFATSIDLVDVDGDNDLDIVKLTAKYAVAPWNTDGLFVLFNNGDGTFSNYSEAASDAAYMTATADLNNDGMQDIYVVDDFQDYIHYGTSVVPNTSATFNPINHPSARVARNGGNIHFGDLDNDGDLDVGVADVDTSLPPCETDPDLIRKFTIFENDGSATGTMIDPWGGAQMPWSTNVWDFEFFDIDNDGNLDIFTGECNGYGVYINTAASTGGTSLTLGNEPDQDGNHEGWKSSLVVNTTDTYTNTTSEVQQVRIDGFNFYAWRLADPVTPFVVKVLGNDTYVVSAIGATRENTEYSVGTNEIAFHPSAPMVTLNPGETIATGFLDAYPNGTSSGLGSVIPWHKPALPDESWVSGGSSPADQGSVVLGQNPTWGTKRYLLDRSYFYTIDITILGSGGSGNNPPTITTVLNNRSTVIGENVSLAIAATDPDGDPVTISVTGLPSGLSFNASTNTIEGAGTTAQSTTVEVTATDGELSDVQTFTWNVLPENTGDAYFESIVASGVNSQAWTNVSLMNSYTEMVATCSIVYANNSLPQVVRMRNAAGSSLDLMLQNPSGSSLTGEDVHCLVMEAGLWSLPDGRMIEGQKYSSAVTASKGSWVADTRSYLGTYIEPAVFGQVMTYNDSKWSTFWSRGETRSSAPTSSTLATGKHVAEDTDVNRAAEEIGIIVIEGGMGTILGTTYETKRGASAMPGYGGGGATGTYTFDTVFGSAPLVGVVSQSGMAGANGSWAQLRDPGALTSTGLVGSVDEDQIGDSERSHVVESVVYFVSSDQFSVALSDGTGGANNAPIVTTPEDQTTSLDAYAELQIEATDPDGDELTYTAFELPDGLSIDEESGLISGIATQAGMKDVTVHVSDNLITSLVQFKWTVVGSAASALEFVSVDNVSTSSWTPVTTTTTFVSPVAVCTVVTESNTEPELVRMRSLAANGFEIQLQNPSGLSLSGETVYCMVTEEGQWLMPDGRLLEADAVNSTVTDYNASWVGESRTISSSFISPVVFGQVMTSNDSRWSAFWSRGGGHGRLPTTSEFFTGKHVGEDAERTRADEVLGHIIIDAGSGSIAGVDYRVGISDDIIVGQGGNGTSVNVAFSPVLAAPAAGAIVTQTAMDGSDGSWAKLFGANALTSSAIEVTVDEDQLGDPERSHTTEQASYMAFSSFNTIPLTPVNSAKLVQAAAIETVEATFELSVPYPNPFTSHTNIRYELAEQEHVKVSVFDLTGKLVRVLVDAEQAAGAREVRFNGRTTSGAPLPSGMYFVRMESESFAKTCPVVLQR